MQSLIKKVSSANSTIINQVKVGDRVFTLVKKDKTLRGILDGTEIIASAEDSSFVDKLPKIVFSITEDLLDGEHKGIRFKQNRDHGISQELSDNMLAEMEKNNIPIITKNMKSFEPIYPIYDLQEPINFESVMRRMPGLLNTLENIAQILEISTNDSMVLTKRKLINAMWGADKTQVVIDMIRDELVRLLPEADRLNLYYELIRKSVARLSIFYKRTDCDSINIINNILIPDILNNFENIKRFASDLFFVMSPIIHIDEVFIQNTTYPAKFFLPMETIESISDDYKLIIEFLNKVPSIDQEILNPLDLLRYNSKKIG